MPFLSHKKSLIGLDIQDNKLKLLQLKRLNHKFLLEQAAVIDLPATIFSDGIIQNWAELQAILTKIVQSLGIKNSLVAISLPISLVEMQPMQLPLLLTEAEREEEIYAQVRRDFPHRQDDLCIDYIETEEQTNTNFVNLLIAVTSRDYLSRYLSCIHATGLKVKIVDITTYAQQRALSFAAQPFLQFEINAKINKDWLLQHSLDFLVACGLAMREIPKW